MCECIIESEKKITDHLIENHPDKNFNKESYKNGFQNKSYSLKLSESFLNNEFKLEYTFLKKDGNASVPRMLTISVAPSYCCFCGEKLTNK